MHGEADQSPDMPSGDVVIVVKETNNNHPHLKRKGSCFLLLLSSCAAHSTPTTVGDDLLMEKTITLQVGFGLCCVDIVLSLNTRTKNRKRCVVFGFTSNTWTDAMWLWSHRYGRSCLCSLSLSLSLCLSVSTHNTVGGGRYPP
jgi:hypothetical protein